MKSLIKPLVLFVIVVLLMLPLTMVKQTIRERSSNRFTVIDNIAQSWTREQVISGPVLILDLEIKSDKKQWSDELKKTITIPWIKNKKALIRPLKSQWGADLDVSYRHRGIFKVPVYTSHISLQAEFDKAQMNKLLNNNRTKIISASIETLISDTRGLDKSPASSINGEMVASIPGLTLKAFTHGYRVIVAPKDIKTGTLKFNSDFQLRGLKSLEFAPSGQFTSIRMNSLWPHPSFQGNNLPVEHSVNDNGFQARWEVSPFSSGLNQEAEIINDNGRFKSISNIPVMGVSLFDPVDQYTLTDRATKYGLLIIILVFVGFYLFEVLAQLSIHPLQYALMGTSLAIFFLLLLSLSEHTGFTFAYCLAVMASAGLIVTYIYPSIGGRASTLLSLLMLGIYAAIYAILKLQDHALLAGSILLFTALATVMLLTRKVDWYKTADRITTQSNNIPHHLTD